MNSQKEAKIVTDTEKQQLAKIYNEVFKREQGEELKL